MWDVRTFLPLLLLAACAPKVPRMPGPLGSMGRDPAMATIRVDEPRTPRRASRQGDRTQEDLAEAARHYLDVAPRGFRDDCSGYVEAVFARVGMSLEGSTASFYDLAKATGALHHQKAPAPGDLAFFDDTYDRNRNGRLDDPLSHVAVVLEVRPNGTILMGHGGTSRGRTTLRMNLARPDAREDEAGEVLNDWLRVKRDSDPGGTKYLSGELWKAFATFSDRLEADGLAAREPTP
jgi:peptidoglycan DL-endopeptidase CwlO